MDKVELIRIIEALLFVADKPLTGDQIATIAGAEPQEIREAMANIEATLSNERRGYELEKIAGGYQFSTPADLSPIIKKYAISREKKKLTPASMETLSIVAYKQPITRQEMEYIRGVNVDGSVRTLLDKGLIRQAGKKDVPGKPSLYATTKEFLLRFGLAGLRDLPKLAEFTENDIDLPDTLKLPEGEEEAAVEDEAPSSSADSQENHEADQNGESLAETAPQEEKTNAG